MADSRSGAIFNLNASSILWNLARDRIKFLIPMRFNALEEEFRDKVQRRTDIAMLEVCASVAMGSFYERMGFKGFQD